MMTCAQSTSPSQSSTLGTKPSAVEQDDLAASRKVGDIALEIPLGALAFAGAGNAAIRQARGLRRCVIEVPSRPRMSALAIPTPIIDPIKVCELDAGSPKYQVPRFQIVAAINSAKTMAKPALLPTCKISSTGSNETMPNATAPDDSKTPSRLNIPDQTTWTFSLRIEP
jgi:hypothetical protein